MTSLMYYGLWIFGAAYFTYRLWSRPVAKPTSPSSEMTLAIKAYESSPTAANAARVKKLFDLKNDN